jgi:hypothetical protein
MEWIRRHCKALAACAALLIPGPGVTGDGSAPEEPPTRIARGEMPAFQAPNGCHNVDLFAPAAVGEPAPRVLPLSLMCPFEPRTDCHHPMTSGRSHLMLLDHPRKRTRDKLKWSFKKGDETAPAELGDPTTDTDYELCIYIAYGDSCFLTFHPDAPAGEGWSRRRNGYAYKPGRGEHPDGLRKLRVRSGPDRKVSSKVKSKGDLVDFALLPFPEGTPVLAQLYNSEGACWSTEFGQLPRKNTIKKFRDRSED